MGVEIGAQGGLVERAIPAHGCKGHESIGTDGRGGGSGRDAPVVQPAHARCQLLQRGGRERLRLLVPAYAPLGTPLLRKGRGGKGKGKDEGQEVMFHSHLTRIFFTPWAVHTM